MFVSTANRFRHQSIYAAGLAALAFSGGTLNAAITVLYADDFSGTPLTGLNGLAPDTRSGTFGSSSTGNWAAGVQFEADGRVWSSPNSRTSALLAFTPVAGQQYELTADIDGVSTFAGQQNDWVAMGFSEKGNVADHFARTATQGYAWMTVSSLGGEGQGSRYAGSAANPTAGAATFATTTGVMSLKILLDTRDTNWTVTWLLDGVQVTDTHTYTVNPVINYVGFSRDDNARVYIDNFQLAVVPEPASFMTLASGMAGLMMVMRRRRD